MKMGTGMKTGAAFLAAACLFCPAAATAAGGEASELQADAVEYNSKTGEMTATACSLKAGRRCRLRRFCFL